MALTPASLRLDLKCGKGAISEGEKCHVGPATKVQEKPATKKSESKGLTGKQKAQVAGLVAYAALGAASLYQLKNIRKAYSEKFDPAQRYRPFEKTLGDPTDVLNTIARSDKQAGPSLFGDVSFGKYKDKDVVVKSFGKKGPLGSMQINLMQQQGLISKKTADALVRGQNALQMNEVQGAFLAGQLGIGPEVVAAGNGTRRTLLGPERENILVTEVAKGRPLSSQDALIRQGPKLQAQLQQNPGAAIRKIAALKWRGFTKGTEISSVNKDRIIRNLRKMHTMGMSHNDLHPGNIFISKEGAQFIDFGTSDRGGASVASEFVRLMNPPRTGLQQAGGMGYNLRSMDPTGYKAAEARMRQVIGKRVGKLTSADIQKALAKSKNKQALEYNLQRIVDEFYVQYGKRTDALTPASVRTDATRSKPCGASHIPASHTCHKKGSSTARKAIAVGLGVAALGAGAYALSRRKPRNQAAPQTSVNPSASGGQSSQQPAKPAIQTTSTAPVKVKTSTPDLTKTQKAQTTSSKQVAPRKRPQSVFAAFKKHALETEGAKPILWDKTNNFLIAANTVGTKYGYTLTPEGMWVSLKVGGSSDEVDFQMRAYNNKVPTRLSEESAKATFNRLSKMFLEATKDKKPDTLLWTQTARERDLQTSSGAQLGTNTLRLGTDPENARTKFYKALGFEFDPESGEVGRTAGDIRTYLSASNSNRLTRGDSIWALTPVSVRTDAARSKPCGQSHIPASHTCHKRGGGMSTPKKAAIAAGLTAAALGIGAVAYAGRRKRTQVGPVRVAPPPRPSRLQLPGTPEPDYPRLPGITPKGLLPPARKRKSKTQRMRENTAAAVTAAEQRIAQTAKEEVRRLSQIGNTMAAAGEAAGMATKTAARELRLRTEAARRRFEPGYRRPDQKRLPESTLLTPALLMAFPEGVPLPTSTPRPRRRRPKPRGFGRTDAAGPCWKGYVQVGMKRKGGRRVPNCVPASSGVARSKAQSDTWATGFDAEDGKKYSKTVTNPKTGRKNKVRYGAKGYTIAPGTDKGDRYCARSFGDMKSHGKDCAGKDRNTPLCLSRAKWKCSGKTSRRS